MINGTVCTNRSQPASFHTSPETFCAFGRKQARPIPPPSRPLERRVDRSLHSSVMFAGHRAQEMTSFLLIQSCLHLVHSEVTSQSVYTLFGAFIDRRLSGVTLAAVNSSRRRRALVPDAVRLVSVRCGGLDWTCRQRARGSPDVFLTPPTGGLQNIASVVHEPRNR